MKDKTKKWLAVAGLLACLLYTSGGDVKLMGACGLILGASQALTGLFLALCLLVLWHAAGNMGIKKNRKKQKEEKEQAYPLVPFLFAGKMCIRDRR